MKTVLHGLGSGTISLVDSPVPVPSPCSILVQAGASVLSPGTERMLVKFGRSGLIRKAQTHPERVRAVIEKARADGIMPTLEAVRAKLEEASALGYCSAGTVVEVGAGVQGFRVGDRVVTNGPHAEYVCVPWTLAAKIPDGITLERAAFTPLAAIGLQGLRVAKLQLGETVVVYGLGLVGLLAVQLAKAVGTRVLGIDVLEDRLELAERFGAIALGADGDVVERVQAKTGGVGADAVLLTLASESDEPIHNAAQMSRKKGRLVLVGVTGMRVRREDYYEKELSLSVSCSYGPGRYDPDYEERGLDYPLPYVRWTAKRNFEAVLELMAEGKVNPAPLISHRFPIEDAERAYSLLLEEKQGLGIVLQYPQHTDASQDLARVIRTGRPRSSGTGVCRAGVIGAGIFARRTVLPILRALGVAVECIASRSGRDAAVAARKYGIPEITSDPDHILASDAIDTVFVLTRHDTHATLARRALEAGKHAFAEKPLALNEEELAALKEVALRSDRLLTVGFNRRFADLTRRAAGCLDGRAGSLSVIITVNAGRVPEGHWVRDPQIGGGRVVGEACHFIDLARALVRAPVVSLKAVPAREHRCAAGDDGAHLFLLFSDGSTAAIHYLTNGPRRFPKERVECFFDGKGLVIDNWRRFRAYGVGGRKFSLPRRQDKGHRAQLQSWVRSVRAGGPPPIPLDEVFEVSELAIRAAALTRRA